MNTKKLAGAAAVGAVSAVTTLLLGATPALAQESSTDYAFALEASGALDINPISLVESTDGTLVSDELLSIGDVAGKYEDDLSVGLLTAEAESHRAETAVKEVNLFNLLRADLIRTWCDNGEGGLQVVNGTILGKKIPDTSVPGEEIDLSPLLKLSLNDQVRHSDGSLTVTGIELKVLPVAEADADEPLSNEEKKSLPLLGELVGKPLTDTSNTVKDVVDQLGVGFNGDLQTITIGQANCQEGGSADSDGDENGGSSDDGAGDDGDDNGNGGDDDGGNDDGDDKGGDNSDVKSAPAPSVVQAALPVTG
ncbi:choice-of-anchor P family protein [Pseudonocardia sichuanensis]